MKVLINLPVNGDKCGECTLAKWQANPNGWSWTCPLFSMRLSERYYTTDAGWKKQKMRNPAELKRCRDCVAATDAMNEPPAHISQYPEMLERLKDGQRLVTIRMKAIFFPAQEGDNDKWPATQDSYMVPASLACVVHLCKTPCIVEEPDG